MGHRYIKVILGLFIWQLLLLTFGILANDKTGGGRGETVRFPAQGGLAQETHGSLKDVFNFWSLETNGPELDFAYLIYT